MSARHRERERAAQTSARYLFRAAALSYAANCALGTAVATRRLDTSGFRWVHHAVFVCTVLLAGAAASSVLWGDKRAPARRGHRTPAQRSSTRRAAAALAPAAIPFALIPRISAKSPRHIAVALSAAPFVLGAAALAGR